MWVCGLAWNSGGAGIRSVAAGLHDVLGVGELVELVDVGLGNHDVDGGEHSGLLVGSCIRVFLLGEAGDRPAGLARGACQRGWRRRDPACQTRKAPDELGSCVRRLIVIAYPCKNA